MTKTSLSSEDDAIQRNTSDVQKEAQYLQALIDMYAGSALFATASKYDNVDTMVTTAWNIAEKMLEERHARLHRQS